MIDLSISGWDRNLVKKATMLYSKTEIIQASEILSMCINVVLYQMEHRREDALKKYISFFEFSFS